ncbi:Asp/Glu racemase [Sulfitobacter mediterraneus]|uniref:maleate cis-trans isomerase family protein n=1 Tax=Sulfitobacter mediterraneus TaxID=83219 RepID=UPI0019318831|nr:aspartate/glutamate racemase family protein [Sulfitobacter mediterraneus]MBM1311183.1 Asp/Glu racemase [Sulfitobacter mediterraneus]MBM1315065.1 Asp/Glu racemase [Sulfitobacter mediterraneus]MBM1323426.1 Asp/Glu racemase [Sulfitobacter mediterraneus]MBM1327338.1 Asp/Glu racemase [Sulfitobacter mediterraneus]MBM1398686.1 Asp/Glu racemase [Sulfitobacter mediterraneus]
MTHLPYRLDADDPAVPPMGLIVLQTDETLEGDMRHYFAGAANPIYVTRIASAPEVSQGSLAAMKGGISAAADLLPKARPFRVVGYGCTSASSVIGSQAVAEQVQKTCKTAEVTNPLRAAVAYAAYKGISRLALLSPYVAEVNETLRGAFAAEGIETPVFGSFGVAEEEKVVRISARSLIDAAINLGRDDSVQGVFMSCTNLRTWGVIDEVSQMLGKPVLSSNQALAWHMAQLNSAG